MRWKFWSKSAPKTAPETTSAEPGSMAAAPVIRSPRRWLQFPNAAVSIGVWGLLNTGVPLLLLLQGTGLLGGAWSPRAILLGSTFLAALGVWAAGCYARACRGQMFIDPPYLPVVLSVHPVLAFLWIAAPAGLGSAVYASLILAGLSGWAVYAWCGWLNPVQSDWSRSRKMMGAEAGSAGTTSVADPVADKSLADKAASDAFVPLTGGWKTLGASEDAELSDGEFAQTRRRDRFGDGAKFDLPAVLAITQSEPDGPACWMTRTSRSNEPETVSGGARVEFASGQKVQSIHIPFLPPLSHIPEVTVSIPESTGVRVQSRVYAYGVRLELKRTRSAEEPLSFSLEYAAQCEPLRGRAAA